MTRDRSKERQAAHESKLIVILIILFMISYYQHPQAIPYLHFIVFPFMVMIEVSDWMNKKRYLAIMDFPMFVHVLIAFYVLVFKEEPLLFSLCWILSVGWCAFSVVIQNNVIYFTLPLFFKFYVHFSPILLMHIIAHYSLYDRKDLKHTPEVIPDFLHPISGTIIATLFFIVWSVINVTLIPVIFKPKEMKKAFEDIPFIDIARRFGTWFCPSKVVVVEPSTYLIRVSAIYLIVGCSFLWITSFIACALFKYPNRETGEELLIVSLLIFGAVKGIQMAMSNVERNRRVGEAQLAAKSQ